MTSQVQTNVEQKQSWLQKSNPRKLKTITIQTGTKLVIDSPLYKAGTNCSRICCKWEVSISVGSDEIIEEVIVQEEWEKAVIGEEKMFKL